MLDDISGIKISRFTYARKKDILTCKQRDTHNTCESLRVYIRYLEASYVT